MPDQTDQLRARVDPGVRAALLRSHELGFLGTMAIDAQIDHALGFVSIIESLLGGSPRSAVDLGTGGGVPGLVMVACWPEARVTLLDGNERRTAFLQETIDSRGMAGNAQVVRGRAEELGHNAELRQQFQVVTSRSFGIPALTAECGSAFLEVGGWMVVSEPPEEASAAERWPEAGLVAVGLLPETTLRIDHRFGYQVLSKTGSLADRFPRRVGVPVKRPLF